VPSNMSDVVATLRKEFIEQCVGQLGELDQTIANITNGVGDAGTQSHDVQRTIHSIKGSAGSYGFKLVTTIARRLEDYIDSSGRLGNDEWAAIQEFVDQIRSIIEGGEDPPEPIQDSILDKLPTTD
jgi:HPt (histidine-containing phosphotransfer) domain-containing protein